MLEPLSFDVHITPVVTKFAGEIGFEDAMAANHLQRGAAALRCELHAAIRHMLDEPRLRETLHHAAHGRRSDVEHFGDVAGSREAALTGEVENRLQIVFDRPRERRRRVWSTGGSAHEDLPEGMACQRDSTLA